MLLTPPWHIIEEIKGYGAAKRFLEHMIAASEWCIWYSIDGLPPNGLRISRRERMVPRSKIARISRAKRRRLHARVGPVVRLRLYSRRETLRMT